MPASIYAWLPEEREDEERKQLLEGLYRELDECTEVKITTRNRLKIFLPERGIWHIWDIDYAVRQEYEKSLHGTIAPNCYPTYMNEFDWIKRHYNIINTVCGVLLIAVGVLMATGTLGRLLAALS